MAIEATYNIDQKKNDIQEFNLLIQNPHRARISGTSAGVVYHYIDGEEIIVRSLKQPNPLKVEINGNNIEYVIEKELGIELVGDIKVKVETNDEDDNWDEIVEDVSYERLSEILLGIRNIMDEADVSFYVIDCILEYPRPEDDGEWKEGRVEVMTFLYDDIYEEGLIERVRASDEEAKAYYARLDALK